MYQLVFENENQTSIISMDKVDVNTDEEAFIYARDHRPINHRLVACNDLSFRKFVKDLAERILALNDIGCSLIGRDGHIWIEGNNLDDNGDFVSELSKILKEAGVCLNNKIYGGILEALDTIDEALRLAGSKNLLDRYIENKDRIFFGEPGVGISRIFLKEKGQGGIY